MQISLTSDDNEDTHISDTAGSGGTTTISNGTSRGVVNEDVIKCEILSRLPVKSFMRFKCVSKTWLSLIEEDPQFADLHYAHAKARPSILFVIPRARPRDPNNPHQNKHDQLTLTANLINDQGSKAEAHKIRKVKSSCYNQILGPVNGVVCFVDKVKSDVCVYNLSTREKTPGVRSTLLMPIEEQWGSSFNKIYEFGFDPTTRKHKVLCICHRTTQQPGEFYIYGPYQVCYVLTIGDNAWRSWAGGWKNGDAVLVAFDVGIEKFRTILIPNVILSSPPSDYWFNQHAYLLQVNGHVAIACRFGAYIAKIWVYIEDTENDNNGTCEEKWAEHTIKFPFCWDRNIYWGFYTGAGVDQILVQSDRWVVSGIDPALTLYSYDLKMKTFTAIEVSGIPSSISNDCSIKLVSSFSESLWAPIQKQQ
ncbi:putative F-box protein At1g32420 [Papaver somniferum]|uniref:putative F-box protein At1g32420 n=1 Tax=Papaver somniferum TaxID=3469 RepID=UPI000E6FA78A|nr:putative F-box protein At1g32420 [Papaver somniferum]